jgi:hypothetical protein
MSCGFNAQNVPNNLFIVSKYMENGEGKVKEKRAAIAACRL